MSNIITTQGQHHLYLQKKDGGFHLEKKIFDIAWLKRKNLIFNQALGRAPVYMFDWQGKKFVLKHYCRGGLPAKFCKDKYLYTRLENTRVYREFDLLCEMKKKSLPVSDPCFARVTKQGVFYQADIVTEYLADSISLAESLCEKPLSKEVWQLIGITIRKFHHKQIFHSDLNANNILLTKEKIFLIDFDQSKMKKGNWWKKKTLDRLNRSLLKIKKKKETFHFENQDWQYLVNKP